MHDRLSLYDCLLPATKPCLFLFYFPANPSIFSRVYSRAATISHILSCSAVCSSTTSIITVLCRSIMPIRRDITYGWSSDRVYSRKLRNRRRCEWAALAYLEELERTTGCSFSFVAIAFVISPPLNALTLIFPPISSVVRYIRTKVISLSISQ